MANLYELTAQIEDFELEVDEETGEITNIDELDALQLERDEKIENIALWIKNLTADAAAIKAEAQNLTKRQKTAENKAQRLKDYLAMNLAGQKFKTPKVSISYRTTKSTDIVDENVIPEEYLEPQKPKIKKADILAALKAEKEVPGAVLIEKKSIQIK